MGDMTSAAVTVLVLKELEMDNAAGDTRLKYIDCSLIEDKIRPCIFPS